ncbi:MAG: hypothetical protein ACTS9Y_08360 [Methylophilus sp.]|uniref:hypothetical protein n=1 Tax=Methylophilus sp. TaxID=29541 RepID=UPI003FA0C5A0
MYNQHPSLALRNLFKEKPYQGANPEKARFIFMGLDANYAANIDSSSVYDKILEYHTDGVAFWKKYNVHHPFLLGNYFGDGKKYHKNFTKIGLLSTHADDISFIELINVPTVGRSMLTKEDLNSHHLKWLGHLIESKQPKSIFISNSVLNLLLKTELSKYLSNQLVNKNPLSKVSIFNDTTFYKHLHFSNYGKFQLQMDIEAKLISQLILNS